jgi:hypothetical protein
LNTALLAQDEIIMMMLCPICADEFLLRIPACPNCGCNLVPETLTEVAHMPLSREEYHQLEFVELCRPKLIPVAQLVKQTLEQNGIPTIVQGGNALSLLPHLAFGGELRVLVDSRQLSYARQLYEAYFENQDDIDYLPEGVENHYSD